MSGLYQIPGLVLTALCHVIVICHMAEHRYSQRKFIWYGAFYAAGFVGMSSLAYAKGGNAAIFTYIVIVVWTFSFSCMVSKDCFPKKCFLFITYFCLFSVIDNVMRIIIKLLLPQMAEIPEYFLRIILRSAALLILLALYKKYAVSVIRSLTGLNGRRWWNLALTAFLFYAAQAVFSVLYALEAVPSGFLLVTFMVISFIMCAVYGVVFSNISYMKKETEAELVRQNAEYLSARLSVMQNAEDANRRMRHDVRHHLEAIGEYAKEGNISAILSYIEEYGVEISETAVRQYSVNGVLNSIFSAYGGKAAEHQIDYSVKCNAPEKLSIRDIDLIALLGNLLENALHGCQNSGKEDTCIDIHIRLQGSTLIILCENTCTDDLKLSGNLPEGKSIGISSILSVCRKYDGSLDYSLQDGKCSACAFLNL
ncbi:MAG: sensor histidine kinase [Lachnospiraceae bacterium]|nr:sensor histidine kinase [Lachnospiraceae bacterium]